MRKLVGGPKKFINAEKYGDDGKKWKMRILLSLAIKSIQIIPTT